MFVAQYALDQSGILLDLKNPVHLSVLFSKASLSCCKLLLLL